MSIETTQPKPHKDFGPGAAIADAILREIIAREPEVYGHQIISTVAAVATKNATEDIQQ